MGWEKNRMVPEDKTLIALSKALKFGEGELIAYKYLNKLAVSGVDLKSLLRPEILVHYGDVIPKDLRPDHSEAEMIAARLVREKRWMALIKFAVSLAEPDGEPNARNQPRGLGSSMPWVFNESTDPYTSGGPPPATSPRAPSRNRREKSD